MHKLVASRVSRLPVRWAGETVVSPIRVRKGQAAIKQEHLKELAGGREGLLYFIVMNAEERGVAAPQKRNTE